MLGLLSRWLERRRRDRAAVSTAVERFEAVTGNRAHVNLCSVIGRDARGAIVRVCFGRVKPPGRKWYVVSAGGEVVAELSFAEAGRFGERRWL